MKKAIKGEQFYVVRRFKLAKAHREYMTVIKTTQQFFYMDHDSKMQFRHGNPVSTCGQYCAFDSEQEYLEALERRNLEGELHRFFSFPHTSLTTDQLRRIKGILEE